MYKLTKAQKQEFGLQFRKEKCCLGIGRIGISSPPVDMAAHKAPGMEGYWLSGNKKLALMTLEPQISEICMVWMGGRGGGGFIIPAWSKCLNNEFMEETHKIPTEHKPIPGGRSHKTLTDWHWLALEWAGPLDTTLWDLTTNWVVGANLQSPPVAQKVVA
ncbi:hypothetical protein B0H13DRAFT_1886589 [Mycena leptocephala]|nr:hypothetical protein B0H13DRAFT_1886589 [Mycena leptocephala]